MTTSGLSATLDLSSLTAPELERLNAVMSHGIRLAYTAQRTAAGRKAGCANILEELHDVHTDVYDELDLRNMLWPRTRTSYRRASPHDNT